MLHSATVRQPGIARYICQAESADLSLEVAYDGGSPAPGNEPSRDSRDCSWNAESESVLGE
jgi:hypothetical protein